MQLGTVSTLAKGLNTIHVAPKAPLINKPRRATQSLLFQAQKKINKGQNRKAILDQLQTSTARKPAAVVAAAPAVSAPGGGFGGSGYSGNVASRLGQMSNPGNVIKAPTPAPAVVPATTPAAVAPPPPAPPPPKPPGM